MPVTASDPDQGYPDDLVEVLRHVALDKLATTRRRLANHPETREFLELGLQLLREDFIGFEGAELDGIEHCRLFESVSLSRLLELGEANDTARSKPLVLSAAKFKERWSLKNRYTEDLIAYLFRTAPQEAAMDAVDQAVDSLIATESFGQLIRLVAATELDLTLNDPLFPLHNVVEVTLPNHPRVQAFLRAQEQILLPRWAAIYKRITSAYGLQLAPGYTWLDLAHLFNSVINGVLTAARTSNGIPPSLASGDNVLVGAIFAMIPTLLAKPTPVAWDDLYVGRNPADAPAAADG